MAERKKIDVSETKNGLLIYCQASKRKQLPIIECEEKIADRGYCLKHAKEYLDLDIDNYEPARNLYETSGRAHFASWAFLN